MTNKTIVSTGDFNVNLLDFNKSKKVQVLLMFNFGMIPAINKGKGITMQTATAIDHILANTIVNNEFQTGTNKANISKYFLFN